jgi:hypothetical protein
MREALRRARRCTMRACAYSAAADAIFFIDIFDDRRCCCRLPSSPPAAAAAPPPICAAFIFATATLILLSPLAACARCDARSRDAATVIAACHAADAADAVYADAFATLFHRHFCAGF